MKRNNVRKLIPMVMVALFFVSALTGVPTVSADTHQDTVTIDDGETYWSGQILNRSDGISANEEITVTNNNGFSRTIQASDSGTIRILSGEIPTGTYEIIGENGNTIANFKIYNQQLQFGLKHNQFWDPARGEEVEMQTVTNRSGGDIAFESPQLTATQLKQLVRVDGKSKVVTNADSDSAKELVVKNVEKNQVYYLSLGVLQDGMYEIRAFAPETQTSVTDRFYVSGQRGVQVQKDTLVYLGQSVFTSNGLQDGKSEKVRLRKEKTNGSGWTTINKWPTKTVTDGVVTFDTVRNGNKLEADDTNYQIYSDEDGELATFSIVKNDINASVKPATVYTGSKSPVTINVTTERTPLPIIISSKSLNATQIDNRINGDFRVEDIDGDGQNEAYGFQFQSPGQYKFDPSGLDAGEYTFTVKSIDGVEKDSFSLRVSDKEPQSEFADASFKVTQGGIHTVKIDLSNTRQHYFILGGKDTNVRYNLTLQDGTDFKSANGQIRLQINTHYLGINKDKSFKVLGGKDSMEINQYTMLGEHIEPIDYHMTLKSVRGEQNVHDTGLMRVMVGPEISYEKAEITPYNTKKGHVYVTELTKTNQVPENSVVVLTYNFKGMAGILNQYKGLDTGSFKQETGLAYEKTGLYFTISDSNTEMNTAKEPIKYGYPIETRISLDNQNLKVIIPLKEFKDVKAGQKHHVTLHLDSAYNEYTQISRQATATFVVEEETLRFTQKRGQGVEIPTSKNATVKGVANMAPGRNLTLVVKSYEPEPYFKRTQVEVQKDGTFEATIDTSSVNAPQPVVLKFENEEYRQLAKIVKQMTPLQPFIQSQNVPSTLKEGESGVFIVNAKDYQQNNLKYTWTFGDGTVIVGQRVAHAYDQNGTYNVRLVINDGTGRVVTKQYKVFVENVKKQQQQQKPTNETQTNETQTNETQTGNNTDPFGNKTQNQTGQQPEDGPKTGSSVISQIPVVAVTLFILGIAVLAALGYFLFTRYYQSSNE